MDDKCPDNIYIEIEPWEMSAVVNWTVPKVNQDNCLAVPSLPPPQPKEFEDKYPGMDMDVGAHIVKYSFKDAHGNPYHEECIFEVRSCTRTSLSMLRARRLNRSIRKPTVIS